MFQGRALSIVSVCPEKSVLLSGGGECLGFLNTEHVVVLTKSAPDPVGAAWNVECTNMNREAGEAQAKPMSYPIYHDGGVVMTSETPI